MPVDAYEIDSTLKPSGQNLTLFNEDYLLAKNDRMYDLIIANPPYVIMRLFGDKYKPLYKEFIYGQSNIYVLFIARIIQQLLTNGTAILIIPTSFRMNAGASRVRKFMLDNCEVIDVVNYGNFSKEVKQNIMVMMLKKRHVAINTALDGNTITDNGCQMSLSEELTIEKLGCVVKLGTHEWNKHKEELTDDDQEPQLLYSFNITGGEAAAMKRSTGAEKKQFIRGENPGRRTFIAVPRICNSVELKAKLFIDARVVVENHVITIEHPDINVLQQLMTVPFKRRNLGSVMVTLAEVRCIAVAFPGQTPAGAALSAS